MNKFNLNFIQFLNTDKLFELFFMISKWDEWMQEKKNNANYQKIKHEKTK